EPMQELIERDLGPFSGQLVKDKKEYFALAAGDHVEGMEPFADVQKRMEHAMDLLSETGHRAVVAVSHGAAINVLLAGLTNNEIGTGKTKLYNGAINVIEGSKTQGFHVRYCNLPPDAPQTRQLLQQMGYEQLERSLVDTIKEEQAKLGFRKEAIRLYYPLSSLNHFFDAQDGEEQMLDRLQHLPDTWQNTLGAVGVTAKKERFCFYIPEQGSEYVHAHGKPNEFIQKLVDLVARHDCTMSKIRDLFYGHSSQVESKKIENGEFDWMFHFTDDPEDPYYYCFKDEGIHIIYHRFLPDDYEEL
ncbi:MAG: DUF3877 family protein, partial [Lachnospiraceae bacterium]|nr:DUF3877 family protein [Lachnospiraceae bacterium]